MKQIFKNSRFRNDIILAAVLLLVAAAAILFITLCAKTGKSVTVIRDGKEIARYSLNRERRVVLNTGKGQKNFNVLVIKNGRAFIEKADCPDKICVSHAQVSKDGETIVCLPHKLVIEISGDKNE